MTETLALDLSLSYAYRDRLIFEGLNLRVAAGSGVGVLGRMVPARPLIKCMVGRLRARTGTVRLHGQDVTSTPLWRRARLGSDTSKAAPNSSL